jgi:TonB family protein
MLTALMFLASTAAVAPPPQHLQGLFASSDYPPGALDRNEQGAVYFQVVVNPEGRVDNCTILLSSGYNDLDYVTCQLVTKRELGSLQRRTSMASRFMRLTGRSSIGELAIALSEPTALWRRVSRRISI